MAEEVRVDVPDARLLAQDFQDLVRVHRVDLRLPVVPRAEQERRRVGALRVERDPRPERAYALDDVDRPRAGLQAGRVRR